AEDEIAQLRRAVGEARLDAVLPGVEVAQQRRIVARPPLGAHEAPQRAGALLEAHLELPQPEQLAPAGRPRDRDKSRRRGQRTAYLRLREGRGTLFTRGQHLRIPLSSRKP